MATTAIFGKTGINSRVTTASKFSPVPASSQSASPQNEIPQSAAQPDELPEFIGDNLNNLNLSLGYKASYIAPDKSIILAFVLWLFLGGTGAHRFYLGHKFVGIAFVAAGVIALASLFGAGFTAVSDTYASKDVNMASLFATFGFVVVYLTWTFVDIFYIGIRYLINKHG